MMPKLIETPAVPDSSISQRIDAIIAAIEPPVTGRAVAALAEKAQTAAISGPVEDRAEWQEIARELALRVALYR
jgi:hypothetical protein